MKNSSKYICLAIVLFIVASAFFCFLVGGNSIRQEYTNYEKYTIYNIDSSNVIEQEIYVPFSYIESISVFCVNVFPEMQGLKLEIVDEKGKTIFSREYEAKNMVTGYFSELPVRKKLERGHTYKFRFSHEADPAGEEVWGIMTSSPEKNLSTIRKCWYNGEEIPYNLALSMEYKEPSYANFVIISAIIVLAFCFWKSDDYNFEERQ